MNVLSQIINGLHIGSIYALVALGYSMVYGIIKLINFAHGEIIMVGAYAVYVMLVLVGTPLWIAVLVSLLFCACMGMLKMCIRDRHCSGAYSRRGRKQAKAPGHGICPGETHSAATHHGIPKGNVSRGHFLRLLTFWSFNLMGMSYVYKPILSMGLWAFLRKIFPRLRCNRFIKQEKRA